MPNPAQPQQPKFTQHLFAGAVAGFVCDALVHPMDTIRCCLQANRSTLTTSTLSFLKKQSLFSLYRGFGAVAVCTIPAHSIYFTTYQTTKSYLSKTTNKEGEGGLFVNFVSGGVAELAAATIWGPMDVVKQRAQAGEWRGEQGRMRASSREVSLSILRSEGLRGFYKGYSAALAVYLPFTGIYFMTYEEVKKISQKNYQKWKSYQSENKYQKHFDAVELPFIGYLCSAAMAGGIAAAVTSPLDVVKTRLQLEKASLPDGYKGMKDAFVRIFKEEGPKAFGKGLLARILWITPGTAISMATYEVCIQWQLKR
uniref:Mitochondrial carrier protein n=1 Tax=Paramoeba aestuarina TaxID=180227 RepID=A0A7S4KPT4_9EUKA|eukprot:CAMPEP_0201527720 /NCGR_PEP_ID=MMETSP0161_2-20130828/36090_1 /ASSEMBLY_ACC=CAM_ASM_000251 /TAXON_ID=180227 /ORGANISM="Neoparamoeba aestuarina, Strain SoJaBio B1-5/56/2" /LENGTH=310 /DNA_ID=CAMNT_0047928657 /DNA_START=94 /DNA_END=1026 /DNA_ORIENTATION=-